MLFLEELAKDDYWRIRENVARNPNTNIKVLDTLSTDKNGNVRWRVAQNPNTPIQVVQALATDKYTIIQRSVIKNPNTSITILLLIWEIEKTDQPEDVLEALFANPLTPAWLKACIETILPEVIS